MKGKEWLDAVLKFFGERRSWVRISETRLLVALALLSGVAAGISAFVFEWLLSLVQQWSYGRFDLMGALGDRWWIFLLPPIGGALTGFLTHRFSHEARGQGVAEVIFALRRKGARIPAGTVIVKTIASAVTIGTGGSAGPEGPVIQIGGGVGSVIGQILKLPVEHLRVLVAAGAAGGLSAVFNAPIAGVLFAMEVLLRDFVVDAFSLVVLSSVSAAVTANLLLGNRTFLRTPPFALHSHLELAAYFLLGILIAPLARLFVVILTKTETFFESQTRISEQVKPILGGLGVGIIGVFLPPVLGTGHEFMTNVVRGDVARYPWPLAAIILLLGAKMIATSLTLGSGGSGGLLTPCFFLGGTAGAAFAMTMKLFIPSIGGYGPFALVGMGAFFSAMSRAPLTAILLLFELTNEPKVILPAMLCCVMATLVAQKLHPESYEGLRLSKKGLLREELESADPLTRIRAGEVMVTNIQTLPVDMNLAALTAFIGHSPHTGFPVVNQEGRLVGLLSYGELYNAYSAGDVDPSVLIVKDVMRESFHTLPPDATLRAVVRVMDKTGQDRVPIVDPRQDRKLVGLVTRSQILRAYQEHAS